MRPSSTRIQHFPAGFEEGGCPAKRNGVTGCKSRIVQVAWKEREHAVAHENVPAASIIPTLQHTAMSTRQGEDVTAHGKEVAKRRSIHQLQLVVSKVKQSVEPPAADASSKLWSITAQRKLEAWARVFLAEARHTRTCILVWSSKAWIGGHKVQDSLVEQSSQGQFTQEGRQNILATTIGLPEHPGRVRGAGTGIGIQQFFGSCSRSYSYEKMKEDIRKEMTQEITKKVRAELYDEVANMVARQFQQHYEDYGNRPPPSPVAEHVVPPTGFKVNLVKEVKKDRDGIRKELKKCKMRSRKYRSAAADGVAVGNGSCGIWGLPATQEVVARVAGSTLKREGERPEATCGGLLGGGGGQNCSDGRERHRRQWSWWCLASPAKLRMRPILNYEFIQFLAFLVISSEVQELKGNQYAIGRNSPDLDLPEHKIIKRKSTTSIDECQVIEYLLKDTMLSDSY
ncbi:hypothetical protein LR48_Vigan330s000200 [Vigna angularis]|uniref:Uncharacterized protein n=1 Tax=Phaseolus angularis TaxID=3914 RepID=A0A0L9T8H7_PHAAN|nr:hypothetical protein LR48_Vigan330s000200 [Vigna angularis]